MIAFLLIALSSTTSPSSTVTTRSYDKGATLEASVALGTGADAALVLNIWLNERDVLRVQGRSLTTQALFNTSAGDFDAELLMLSYRRRFVDDTSRWTDNGFFLEGGVGWGEVTRYSEPCRSNFFWSSCAESSARDYALSARLGYSLAAGSFLLFEPFAEVTSVGFDLAGYLGVAFQIGFAAGS
ncbi:MAG: hypothetical protein AAFQ82_10990 [Myxococcota bacterium]